MSDSPVSPLAADTPPELQRPSKSLVIAAVLGEITGTLIASAVIVLVCVVWLLGVHLSLQQFVGATLLTTYLRP